MELTKQQKKELKTLAFKFEMNEVYTPIKDELLKIIDESQFHLTKILIGDGQFIQGYKVNDTNLFFQTNQGFIDFSYSD